MPGQGALAAAKDGTNLRACYDGDCEILVSHRQTIRLDPRFGFSTFSFDAGDLTWRYTYPEGGNGSIRFEAPTYAGSWAGPSARQSLGMRVVDFQGPRAVIALHPGK